MPGINILEKIKLYEYLDLNIDINKYKHSNFF